MTARTSAQVTLVAYHYIRDVAGTPDAELKVRTREEFRSQIGYLARTYEPLTVQQLVRAYDCVARGESPALPRHGALLTFDDGYAEHAGWVADELERFGFRGAFFPVANCIDKAWVMDANKIQFVLARVPNRSQLIELLRAEISDFDRLAEIHGKPRGFDDAPTSLIKRLLQWVLPESKRQSLCDQLFSRFVTDDERTFARALYGSATQFSDLIRRGHTVGSHTVSHRHLDQIPLDEADSELRGSIDFLERLGVARSDWTLCYPYTSQNESVRQRASHLGCRAGFWFEPRPCQITSDDRLLIPRFDTNQLPLSEAGVV